MSSKQLRFWKLYFWLCCGIALLSFALLAWVQWDVGNIAERTGEIITLPTWAEMLPPHVIAVGSVYLLGLYGLAYRRRFNIQPIWKVCWLSLLAYDGFAWANMLDLWAVDLPETIPAMIGNFNPRQSFFIYIFVLSALTLVFDVLNSIGLYIYAFRSEELWRCDS